MLQLYSPHLHYFCWYCLLVLILLKDPGEDPMPLIQLGQSLNPQDAETSFKLSTSAETHRSHNMTHPGCREHSGAFTFLDSHLLSSCSMLARLSRPLSHVSKAAWKSLWTIICSAAVSNMLSICVKEEEVSGGLQGAGARLVELMTKNTTLHCYFTLSSLVYS